MIPPSCACGGVARFARLSSCLLTAELEAAPRRLQSVLIRNPNQIAVIGLNRSMNMPSLYEILNNAHDGEGMTALGRDNIQNVFDRFFSAETR